MYIHLVEYHSPTKINEMVIHIKIWTNLLIIILSEEGRQNENIYYAISLISNFRNANKSIVMKNRLIVSLVFGEGKKGWEGGTIEGRKHIFRDDAYVQCPDCDDCFIGIYPC